jgi:hypothetical protein
MNQGDPERAVVKQPFVRSFALSIALLATGLGPLATSAAPGPDVGVSVGSAFVVEPPMAHYLRDLDQREQHEQVRDWAVIATVARLGATPAQAAAATGELPPARLPYFDELYTFEYGRGRRAYLGNRVLLFRDADDPDPQATIGRLADRVRMENGEIPAKVEIYLVHDQRDEGTIQVERAADVAGAKLFSAAYGYVEGTADSVSALTAWLAKADDLAFTRIDHGRVTLGGRRFAKTPAQGLTTEDVAALYQAHVQLDGPRGPAHAKLALLPSGGRAAAEHLLALIEARASKEDIDKADYALAWKVPQSMRDTVRDALVALLKPVQSPGFSLDPLWLPDPSSPQHPLMLSKLQAFTDDPCAALEDIARRADALERAEPDDTRRTAPTMFALSIRKVVADPRWKQVKTSLCPALARLVPPIASLRFHVALASSETWEAELVGYYRLIEQWEGVKSDDVDGDAASLATTALTFYRQEAQAQCARYVGTQGTSVGMTMFYTDLLAKLWQGTDYGLSAPIVDVPGFRTSPRIDLNPAFLAEHEKNPNTRIWFGARASAVSKNTRGQSTSFSFDHTFSRVYAAGHNPTTPGAEARPNEAARQAIGWWDRHFSEIASYEPEYQRLNQIMKWSLVTAALSESNTAPHLGLVRVQRDLRFSDWQQANRTRLRFSESLPALRSSPSDRECLPLLASYSFSSMGTTRYISGGVDSVPANGLARVPTPKPSLPLGARKPYVESLAGDSTGTAVRAHPTVSGEGVEFVDPAGVPTRTVSGDVTLGTPKVTYKAGSTPRAIEIHAGDSQHPVGMLEAEARGNQVKLNWTDGMVEIERTSVPAVPKDLAAADKLAAQGDIVTAARSYQARGATSPTTASDLARDVVVKAAQRNPTAVLKRVQQLEGQGAQLLPASRQSVFNAVSDVGSPSVAAHVQTALDQGLPLTNKYGAITVERGQLIVTRDIEGLSATRLSTKTPTNLSNCEVYLDDRLRVGQEGLIPDTGGPAARWQQRPNVRVEEMKASEIGALPDRIVTGTSTKTTFHHVASSPTRAATPRPVIFLRQCDGDHKTATTDDDCDQP